MTSEKMQILKMIEEGKITADEGMKLMQAVEIEDAETDLSIEPAQGGHTGRPRRLRVRVEKEGKETVNIKIPISLVNVGLKIGKKFSPELQESMGNVDMDEIIKMIQEGAEGRLVEVDDGDEHVEIFVE
ncbi:SHOCT-like domain-containing protein [Fusibacter sp. JL216-2]|uniref:SHOCT-like domain-containing protein n=1 Tax=Fusibacter sp. JL216-2 TaxID=3071453 RepID=UPI003D331971